MSQPITTVAVKVKTRDRLKDYAQVFNMKYDEMLNHLMDKCKAEYSEKIMQRV